MVLVNGGYLHCTDKETLVNSSLKGAKKKKKMARVISKTPVSDPGPSWPSCEKLFAKFDPSPNIVLVNGGLLALYGHKEILKKPLKRLTRF